MKEKLKKFWKENATGILNAVGVVALFAIYEGTVLAAYECGRIVEADAIKRFSPEAGAVVELMHILNFK